MRTAQEPRRILDASFAQALPDQRRGDQLARDAGRLDDLEVDPRLVHTIRRRIETFPCRSCPNAKFGPSTMPRARAGRG